MIRIFLDASVYVAGFISPKGGSGLILDLIRRKKVQLIANRVVLRETDRNLRSKAPLKIVKAFRRFLHETKIEIVSPLTDTLLSQYETLIHPKDAVILGTALEARVDFLMTLDRRHFLTPQVLAKQGKTKILTPENFIEEQVRKHKI